MGRRVTDFVDGVRFGPRQFRNNFYKHIASDFFHIFSPSFHTYSTVLFYRSIGGKMFKNIICFFGLAIMTHAFYGNANAQSDCPQTIHNDNVTIELTCEETGCGADWVCSGGSCVPPDWVGQGCGMFGCQAGYTCVNDSCQPG